MSVGTSPGTFFAGNCSFLLTSPECVLCKCCTCPFLLHLENTVNPLGTYCDSPSSGGYII